jgi:hypothetical protein
VAWKKTLLADNYEHPKFKFAGAGLVKILTAKAWKFCTKTALVQIILDYTLPDDEDKFQGRKLQLLYQYESN